MQRANSLLFALGAAAVLLLLSRTRRGAAVSSGVLEEVAVTAQKVGSAFVSLLTRGLRNNNPGNIRFIADPVKAWRGQVANDDGYGIYDYMENGVRAIGKQLEAYDRRGLRSVRAIISTWAPASENNTSSYVTAVSRALGVGPDDRIDVRSYLPRLAAAIIKHENGMQPLTTDEITRWVFLP